MIRSSREDFFELGIAVDASPDRYAHAHQFKRANRSLRRLKTYLGRVIRDISSTCTT